MPKHYFFPILWGATQRRCSCRTNIWVPSICSGKFVGLLCPLDHPFHHPLFSLLSTTSSSLSLPFFPLPFLSFLVARLDFHLPPRRSSFLSRPPRRTSLIPPSSSSRVSPSSVIHLVARATSSVFPLLNPQFRFDLRASCFVSVLPTLPHPCFWVLRSSSFATSFPHRSWRSAWSSCHVPSAPSVLACSYSSLFHICSRLLFRICFSHARPIPIV